jgi:NhaA family Na+:H+ antiporter
MLLLTAAVVALVWANSPWQDSYESFQHAVFGVRFLHLRLDTAQWAADGLLAIFFFVAGLELKRELVAGELRDRAKAALPIAAALCGVALPALLFVLVAMATRNGNEPGLLRGWAIPTATDIAFALAVLAVIGTHLPSALRSFLLTLAVVDDLVAIVIIAVFYGHDFRPLSLLAALIPLAGFWIAVRRKPVGWLLIPLAVLTWALVHDSGVHATVAGISLGLVVPVTPTGVDQPSLAEHLEHVVRPVSAGFAVPVFALLSAGVSFGGAAGLRSALSDPAALGVITGLVVGKSIGIAGGAYVVARSTRASLDSDVSWIDVIGVAILGGIGFTVSLLIGELAYGDGTTRDNHVKVAILAGSLLAALIAAVVLRLRNRTYRRIHESELLDRDADGIPDIYDRTPPLPDVRHDGI